MKVLLKSGWLVLALWLVSFGTQASCGFASGVSSEVPGYISFGNVAVQRDAAVGSVIATATTGRITAAILSPGVQKPGPTVGN